MHLDAEQRHGLAGGQHEEEFLLVDPGQRRRRVGEQGVRPAGLRAQEREVRRVLAGRREQHRRQGAEEPGVVMGHGGERLPAE